MSQTVRSAAIPGDAARTLLDLVSIHGNGIWHLQPDDADTPDLFVQIENNRLIDLHRPGQPNVLTRALVNGDSLPAKEKNRLEKQALAEGVCAGILCLELGLIDPNIAAEAIGQVVDGDLVLVLGASHATWSGPQPEVIGSGLEGRVDLGHSLEEVLLRSARRHDLWETILDLPLLRDVVAATPAAMSIISDPAEGAETKTLLEAADGHQDIGEIAAVRPDPWRALDRLLLLIAEGHLETQSAMELFQSGEQILASGHSDKALRRWRRAEEKGLDDFDLGARIGRTCAATGRPAEANRRLRAHAQRCSDQLRLEAARDAWSSVVTNDPTDAEARQRALALWQRDPGDDPALCLELARALIDAEQADAACQLLDSVGARIPEPCLHELHEEAAHRAGDPHAQQKARWRRAESLRADGKITEAAAHYEQLASAEQDPTPLLCLRLTEIAIERGDQKEAREYCQQVLVGHSGENRNLDGESRAALDLLAEHPKAPSNLHRWMADNAQRNGESEQEASARQRQCQSHQLESDLLSACQASYRLQQLQPDNLDVALERARLEEEAGNLQAALSTLEQTLEKLPEGHPRENELISTLKQRNRSSRVMLERSLRWTPPGSSQHQSIQLRLGLLALLQGETATTDSQTTTPPQTLVLEIISGLIEDDQNRGSLLQRVGQRVVQQGPNSDPLIELLRAALTEIQPDHPLLTTPTPAPEPPMVDSRHTAVVRTGISGITDKLRNVQSNDDHSCTADNFVPTTAAEETTATEKTAESAAKVATNGAGKGVQTALDRLRSMRGGTPETAAAEATSEPSQNHLESTETTSKGPETTSAEKYIPATPAPPTSTKGLGNAAARLGALREEKSGS
ncbi:MAG: hypothetical protein AAEJ04_03785 [Planctomycetota bacterium]